MPFRDRLRATLIDAARARMLPPAALAAAEAAYRAGLAIAGPRHPLHRNEKFAPFFIVGSGRSGSTLLRRILQASPKLHIPPEIPTFGPAIYLYARNRSLPWHELVELTLARLEYHWEFRHLGISLQPVARELKEAPKESRSLAMIFDRVMRRHADERGSSHERWGDKTVHNSFWLRQIHATFPDAQYIHIIRDGVDVAASFIKTGWMESLEKGALRWSRSVNCVRAFSRAFPAKVHEIRYESMVRESEAAIRGVCEFLGLAFNPGMIHAIDHVGDEADIQAYAHHENVKRPVNDESIGKGRRELGAEERGRLQTLIGADLARLGYEPAI